MREQFHHYLLDSQMLNGPVAMKFNAIMDNIGDLSREARTGGEGTDTAESIAFLVRSRERKACRRPDSGGKSSKGKSEHQFWRPLGEKCHAPQNMGPKRTLRCLLLGWVSIHLSVRTSTTMREGWPC